MRSINIAPAKPLPPQPEVKKPVGKYKVFQCEMEVLEQELNQRDPDGKCTVLSLGNFGSSVKILLRLP